MNHFGIIGTGWRAEFFLRIVAACPERFSVVGIVGRGQAKTIELGERFGVRVYSSVDDLIQLGKPDYVVVSVSRGVAVSIITQLAHMGVPALCETPIGETLDDLNAVWSLVERGARIQVAEQFWAQPHHAARIAFARSGKLGTVSQAQVSVAHGYHGISLIRRFLNVMFEPVTVNAAQFVAPIVEGPGRKGLPDKEKITSSKQTFARFDFGDKLGIFDFTGDLYFSFIRGQRVLVRGERGEIMNENGVYLQAYDRPIRVRFERLSAGINGNLEGNYLKGIQAGEEWVYRNPLAPAALSDEEIAIGTCLLRMAEYVGEGTPFYSAAEACQDRYLDLLMEQALASGQTVTSQPQAWHREG
jgi:predicted dehydrogenase